MENSNKNKFMERANSLSLQKAIIGISTKTDIRNITPTICLVFRLLDFSILFTGHKEYYLNNYSRY